MQRVDLDPLPIFVCLAVAAGLGVQTFQWPVVAGSGVLFSVAMCVEPGAKGDVYFRKPRDPGAAHARYKPRQVARVLSPP